MYTNDGMCCCSEWQECIGCLVLHCACMEYAWDTENV